MIESANCQNKTETIRLDAELIAAVKEGNLEKVKNIIQESPDQIHAKNKQGKTALRLACEKNNVEITEYLISRGADVNSTDNQGNSILFFSCIRFKHDAAKILVQNGADVNSKTRGHDITPLHAIFNPWGTDIKLLNMLIEKGVDVNAINNRNGTPLGWALGKYDFREEAIKILIKNGANVNHTDGKRTLLHIAIHSNSPKKVKLLLENGAKVNQTELFYNNTELHLAAIIGNKAIAELLIQSGVKIDKLNSKLKTPLYYAAKYGHKEVSDLLIKMGADKKNIAEENYGFSEYLDNKLNKRQFYCWNISNNGWVVKTRDHLLIFDPSNKFDTLKTSLLANGHINPYELQNYKLIVFLSKSDRALYYPEILNLGKLHNNVTFYFGFNPEDYPAHKDFDLPRLNYKYLERDKSFKENDLKIRTFKATQSGIGYVVNFNGLTFFYNGWHVSNNDMMLEQYKKTIDTLEPQFREIDCAFLPVTAHLVTNEALNGYYYLLDNCNVQNVLLMHGSRARNAFISYHSFFKHLKDFAPKVGIYFPENHGDRFFIDTSNN